MREEDWQPIETAPRDGTYILLGYEGVLPEDAFAEVGHWELEDWHNCDLMRLGSPSHWMPLVAPRASAIPPGPLAFHPQTCPHR